MTEGRLVVSFGGLVLFDRVVDTVDCEHTADGQLELHAQYPPVIPDVPGVLSAYAELEVTKGNEG